jgi:hypothetical protein
MSLRLIEQVILSNEIIITFQGFLVDPTIESLGHCRLRECERERVPSDS